MLDFPTGKMSDFPTDNMPDFPTVMSDSLDLFQSILISSADGEQSHFVTGSNNGDKTDQNECTNCNKMVEDNELEATTEKKSAKAKKGRRPSKPPTKEVVRKRRKVCRQDNYRFIGCCLFYFPHATMLPC